MLSKAENIILSEKNTITTILSPLLNYDCVLPLLIPSFNLQKLDVAQKLLQKPKLNRICCRVHLRRHYAGVVNGHDGF